MDNNIALGRMSHQESTGHRTEYHSVYCSSWDCSTIDDSHYCCCCCSFLLEGKKKGKIRENVREGKRTRGTMWRPRATITCSIRL